jgi:hypothetical protein
MPLNVTKKRADLAPIIATFLALEAIIADLQSLAGLLDDDKCTLPALGLQVESSRQFSCRARAEIHS